MIISGTFGQINPSISIAPTLDLLYNATRSPLAPAKAIQPPPAHKDSTCKQYGILTLNTNGAHDEKGDWRVGSREVLCPRCFQYIKHGSDSGSQPMNNHWDKIDVNSSTRPPSPIPKDRHECAGAYFKWDCGSLYKTYPFVIHDTASRHSPGYTLLSADFITSVIRVRSTQCTGSTSIIHGCCDACDDLDSRIDIVAKWSRQSFGRKSIRRLSHVQLEAKLIALSRQLAAEQVKKSNYWLSLKAARKRLKEHQQLLRFMSANEVPGLYRLLSNADKEGWGTGKTTAMCQSALEGRYHPKNYTLFHKEFAVLMYELGGGAALHALNKSPYMLPSRHTIAEMRRQQNLRITVGNVKISDILENIEVLFGDLDPGDEGRVGITLSQDEIAGDGRLCYLEETDEIGMGSDTNAAEETVKAIRAGEVHVGKEFSVAAFSRHAPTNYGAKPVLLMPTCKKGSWQSSAQILQKLIHAWKLSPFGEAKHGPLESLASDGEARRRAALYLVCMHKEVKEGDPLFEFLDLPGLNLFTGDSTITMDFDYKHLFKRLCTLLCSREGILVNGVVINKILLAKWLEKLTGHDWSDESIHALLNPKDPQDVPRAIKLICLVADLRQLENPSEFTPAERNTHRALCLLGEMFDALVEPFINPSFSLSEQMIHLVKFAHIACAMFVKHDSAFVSNQLYGDLQCMIKNMIFKIARSKLLNPSLKVFLCLLGDDVLETLFGRSRMIGGHSPNMAIDELRQRLCSALRMDKIFQKYPYLERRARRLRMARSRDVDHLSPRQWEGDITAQSCDIPACWAAGVIAAKAVLAKYGCDIDFAALFARAGFDLMRPKGGKYPGVSKDVDRSLVDASTTESPPDSVHDNDLGGGPWRCPAKTRAYEVFFFSLYPYPLPKPLFAPAWTVIRHAFMHA
ncbi:hypothetical protein B0H11DRAFT_2352833 [Mycena galericulata]|nr:hypothetical protein B0H11DRAFT_2352833 [Mycena galericulata]